MWILIGAEITSSGYKCCVRNSECGFIHAQTIWKFATMSTIERETNALSYFYVRQ